MNETSMHSSRMPTARLLSVSPSMHCGGDVCLWSWRGICSWRGRLSLVQGEGGCIPAYNGADSPLCTEFLTHASENITLPQLRLRLEIIVTLFLG